VTVDHKEDRAVERPADERRLPRSLRYGLLLLLALAAGGLALVIHSGIASRVAAESKLRAETQEIAVGAVTVTHPKLRSEGDELVLPGNIQAFTDAPIYARTNGYLRRWYADIGANVKAGQLLAEIDAPEVDHQLQQARADLETAQANLKLAESTAARWQFLLKTESVSKQETDEKIGDLNARRAMLDSAGSNVKRLEDLQAYEKVFAPFSGVITARSTDIGALINAGAGKELFHLAALDRVRVFVNVPQQYRRSAQPGVEAALSLTEFPGRFFAGRIARNSNSIDAASRTLLVEVDVDNPRQELLPGAYVMVHLKLPRGNGNAVVIPVNTLLFRSEGLRVAVVRDGRAVLTPITVGRDFGNELEVVSGITEANQIIINPSDSLVSGTPVHVGGSSQ
jgi:RND family efflux transporter MFP subunit